MARRRGPQGDGIIARGLLDTLILHVLSQGDNYGFGLLEAMDVFLGEYYYLLQDQTLYVMLHRLEAQGLTEAYWRPGIRGRDRKYYLLTAAGKKRLAERVAHWRVVVPVIQATILAEPEPEEEAERKRAEVGARFA